MMRSAFLLAGAAACSAFTAEDVVQTPLGPVQGIVNPLAREFRGVPYASPPVGALRWKSPQPPSPWAPATYQALQDGAGCLQACHEPPLACPTAVHEDCLYLNVFTPRAAALITPAPVLIFIHGGDFRDGFGGGPLYNGSEMASSQGIVVVSINYRLGLQGFLHANASDDSAADAITGNYGVQDQRQAMRWVRDNIAGFGGDPTRVTISGQSAGAMSVASHLISPASQGLFHGAFIISEPYALPFRTPESAYTLARVVMEAASCDYPSGMRGFPTPAACMRSLTFDELLALQLKTLTNVTADYSELLQIFMQLCPTTGTPDVPNWPLHSFQGAPGAAPVADVPVVSGTTSQEGVLFIFSGFGFNMSSTLYDLLMPTIFGLEAGLAILAQYPVPSPAPADMRALASNVTTAGIFKCPTRNATASLAAQPGRKSPVFVYEYSHLLTWSKSMWGNTTEECWDAVCHGADLPSWWYPLAPASLVKWTPQERTLTEAMLGYVGGFVRTGEPGNSSVGVPWPAITPGSIRRMQLDLPKPVVLNDPAAAECAVFDRFGYGWY